MVPSSQLVLLLRSLTSRIQRKIKEKEGKNETSKLLSSPRIVLLVIGTAVVIGSVAFCNLLTWHFHKLWGVSGDFAQAQWHKILYWFGDDPATYWIYGTTLITFVVYWLVGGIYTFMDLTNRPAALRKYKIQPGTNEPVDVSALTRVIIQVLFNQIAIGLPLTHFGYRAMQWRGFPPIQQLPSFTCFITEIAFHILCEELGFYYSHRLLHNRHLYKYIHKQHHQWTAPIAVTAIYCHPLEHLGSNLLPPFLGPFLLGSHVVTSWVWFTLAILSTLNAHSGYHMPFFPSPEVHDFHHQKFNQCFGVLGILDRFHGTDTMFRSSTAYNRHMMMLSFIPARKAFPDIDDNISTKKQNVVFDTVKSIHRH